MKQAILDYRHVQGINGIDALNNDVSERIHQHATIDLLGSMNNDILLILESGNLVNHNLGSFRDYAIASILRESISSVTGPERKKVFARLGEVIQIDKHCLELFCLQLLLSKQKTDEVDKEIVQYLLYLQENEGFEALLWGLNAQLLHQISERFAPFFKSYVMYLIDEFLKIGLDNEMYGNDLKQRVELMLASPKLKRPTIQYLKVKGIESSFPIS